MAFAHQANKFEFRTQMVREQLADKKAAVKIEGQHRYIRLGPDKKKHLVIEGTVTNFTDEPVAYLDASMVGTKKCEVITLDPNSPVIKQQYAELVAELKIHAKAKPLTPLILFQHLNSFIQKKLGGAGTKQAANQADQVFPEFKDQPHQYESMPVIPLEEFLKRKIGSCRHRALLAAYLLDRLLKDNVIPGIANGKIFYHQQGYVDGSAHNFVIYRDDVNNKLYLVDPMWNKALEITGGINIIENNYGEAFKQRVVAGFYNPPIAAPLTAAHILNIPVAIPDPKGNRLAAPCNSPKTFLAVRDQKPISAHQNRAVININAKPRPELHHNPDQILKMLAKLDDKDIASILKKLDPLQAKALLEKLIVQRQAALDTPIQPTINIIDIAEPKRYLPVNSLHKTSTVRSTYPFFVKTELHANIPSEPSKILLNRIIAPRK